jgi:hypothetical protein
MAKKIIIKFSDNPVAGTLLEPSAGFEYGIAIDGKSIVYDSGLQTVLVNFVPYGTTGYNPQYILEVQPTLTATIQAVFALISVNYSSPYIIYSIVDNTIEVLIKINNYINIAYGDINIKIEAYDEIVIEDSLNLKYFFEYKNIVNVKYSVKIYKKNFTGLPTEINGIAILEKGAVKDHLELIRGTGWTLELEANKDLTLDDLYTENEQDLNVKIYENNSLIFIGYVNPEGLFQSFTRDSWIISLDCVDGLGALSNLSFVDVQGFPFKGKMKAIDIVYYCLLRTGLQMDINVSINTFYDGLSIDNTTDILSKIYLNADRYQKIDNDTIMSCEEVLKSILDLFCACITQEDAQWYIYKPNEIYNDSIVVFKNYNINNVYTGLKTKKLEKKLGSQIDNFYPHHCSGNQNIQIKGSISKYRVNYKYGFVSGLLPNPNLIKNNGILEYNGWTISRPNDFINDPLKNSGFIIKTSPSFPSVQLITADGVSVSKNDEFFLRLSYSTIDPDNGNQGGCELKMIFKIGSFYLSGRVKPTVPKLERALEWTNNINDTLVIDLLYTGDYQILIPNIPVTGTLIFSIERAISYIGNDRITTISEIDLKPSSVSKAEVGEFHTVERATKVSSNIKDNKTIFNGDNATTIYLGAIFKEDQVTPTTLWNRKGRFESFSILRIAAEEELRISQKPLQIFKGSVFGKIPYLSLVEINNVNGKFMAIDYKYNTMTNVSEIKFLELFSAELTDLIYKFTFDYGNVVKPTIRG